ncbi:unnamed protein product [Gulo gulo]|uniref:Uncharacterized protein n=1 Tax=Gulo gulo TaxID=48420 RepID=A0A9X9M930_GULGU|nr:unnamed protein product [Gulo gulo]
MVGGFTLSLSAGVMLHLQNPPPTIPLLPRDVILGHCPPGPGPGPWPVSLLPSAAALGLRGDVVPAPAVRWGESGAFPGIPRPLAGGG